MKGLLNTNQSLPDASGRIDTAAEEARCSLPWPVSTASLPGRRRPSHSTPLPPLDPPSVLTAQRVLSRHDVAPNTLSCSECCPPTLHRDHKPCAVSTRQFRQRGALWLPHLSHQLIYITVSSSSPAPSSKSPNPSSRILIYFLVIAPAPGRARTHSNHSSSWVLIYLHLSLDPSWPWPFRDPDTRLNTHIVELDDAPNSRTLCL